MRKMFRNAVIGVGMASLVSAAGAAIQINEVFTNPPGTDDTQEFFELKSTTGGVEAMTGLTLVVLEGEGGAGTIDAAFNLDSFATGTNGLFYWRANAAVGAISPTPAVASTFNTADFNPDLENGSQTYLLVSGYTGTLTTDLDTNDDGTLDATPWTSVIDAIGAKDNTAADIVYGASLGGTNFPTLPSGFDLETIFRLSTGEWVVGDIGGTNPGGPYAYDGTETLFADGSTAPVASFDFAQVSPGNVNPTVVPEPAALGALALGAILARRRSR